MKLLPNWRTVAKRAWSMRLIAASVVMSAIEIALPFFASSTPSGWFATGALCTSIAAGVLRLMQQQSMVGGEPRA